jgi:phospholipase/carboxylesterase
MSDSDAPMSRRGFTTWLGAGLASAIVGCRPQIAGMPRDGPERLQIPSTTPTSGVVAPRGLLDIGLEHDRDGKLYVPASYRPDRAMPLLILLHGAGGNGGAWFGSYGPRAEAANVIVLAPDSRAATWDVTHGAFGPDVQFINRAMRSTARRYAIDFTRVALAGFSDGASYAISLGIANGDLVRSIIAFSPGFMVQRVRRGTPGFFVSHGTSDHVLHIDRTSRRIVPALRAAGYAVEYTEFDGDHDVPASISDAAMQWLVKRFD